jgi:hypothetical protein
MVLPGHRCYIWIRDSDRRRLTLRRKGINWLRRRFTLHRKGFSQTAAAVGACPRAARVV